MRLLLVEAAETISFHIVVAGSVHEEHKNYVITINYQGSQWRWAMLEGKARS